MADLPFKALKFRNGRLIISTQHFSREGINIPFPQERQSFSFILSNTFPSFGVVGAKGRGDL